MIRCKYSFIAEGVVVDARTQNICAFNILEGISSEGYPIFMQRLSFMALWEREPQDAAIFHGNYVIRSNDVILTQQRVDITFGPIMRHRTIMYLSGFVIPNPGTLTMEIQVDEGPTAGYSIEVVREPTVQIEQNPA